METACIICTVRILIPFALLVLMPSGSKIGGLRHKPASFERLADRRVRIRLHNLCGSSLRLYLCRFVSLSANLMSYGKDNSSYHKYDHQNKTDHISGKAHHPSSSKLLLFFAHSLAQDPLIHLSVSPSVIYLIASVLLCSFCRTAYQNFHISSYFI